MAANPPRIVFNAGAHMCASCGELFIQSRGLQNHLLKDGHVATSLGNRTFVEIEIAGRTPPPRCKDTTLHVCTCCPDAPYASVVVTHTKNHMVQNDNTSAPIKRKTRVKMLEPTEIADLFPRHVPVLAAPAPAAVFDDHLPTSSDNGGPFDRAVKDLRRFESWDLLFSSSVNWVAVICGPIMFKHLRVARIPDANSVALGAYDATMPIPTFAREVLNMAMNVLSSVMAEVPENIAEDYDGWCEIPWSSNKRDSVTGFSDDELQDDGFAAEWVEQCVSIVKLML